MPNPQVPFTNTAINTITPKAADGSVQAVGSLSITIDDYATAYVAKYPAAGLNGFILVPRNTDVGVKTVNVTANATDVNGNTIPSVSFAYEIDGATPPPLATSLQFGTPSIGAFGGVPADPGSATVKLV